jgi:hypothetical protein
MRANTLAKLLIKTSMLEDLEDDDELTKQRTATAAQPAMPALRTGKTVKRTMMGPTNPNQVAQAQPEHRPGGIFAFVGNLFNAIRGGGESKTIYADQWENYDPDALDSDPEMVDADDMDYAAGMATQASIESEWSVDDFAGVNVSDTSDGGADYGGSDYGGYGDIGGGE